MKLNFKTISLGSLAAVALLIAPLTWVHSANANGGGHRRPNLEQLDLTEEQSAQIETIRTDTRSQMEALLTPEQRAAAAGSESPREALRSLDLTDEQRQQMRAIRESSREQIRAVLTDEQQQQLQEMCPERPQGNRQSHR
ncbi:Spy/CpxP family protein refolding chaperone [Romeria aff. gracilis LEGE 07310]|uniref:Spy/CpxP family protein refolding chaperone n=1 Tax=Vasconcelosia minhoensis LEGE 07310 TaxID=915328 RepID=A0A8J7AC43_9CYAN|nr:Spy/CpxP family protein refolding chaperone [Romeria gracilis]MBE9080320.1 Spy/CpxP family protein refolding chaperone [Romeria aff. gracilis LEGE 07310]